MENQNIVQPEKKKLFRRIPVFAVVGLIIGAIGGYIYYAEVGCVSGTCAITSNPWMSTAWGGAFGYLIFDMFKFRKNKVQNNPIDKQ
jgi:xanthine/uracil permease